MYLVFSATYVCAKGAENASCGEMVVQNEKFKFRKILVSVKSLSAILGPEMAVPILWAPGKMRSFCRKNNVHKIPPFRGGILGFFGGGECRFYFCGREDFFDKWTAKFSPLTLRLSDVLRANLRGGRGENGLPKSTPFRRPFPPTTPSSLLGRALKYVAKNMPRARCTTEMGA